MPHIHTEHGQGDHTASAYIILTEGDKAPQVLLHMHKKLDTLLQFGGHVELDETPWQAIAHEIHEESGYDLDDLRVMQPKQRLRRVGAISILHPVPLSMNTHPFQKGSGHFHSDVSFLFVATCKPADKPAGGESAALHWLTQDELNSLANDEVLEDVRLTANFAFDVALREWQAVPTSEFSLGLPEL